MNDQPTIKTLGTTFTSCGAGDQQLFRVNSDIPIKDAMEHASNLFFCAKHLALDAAIDKGGERYAWASHYLCETG